MHVNCFCSNEKLRLGPAKLPNFRQLFNFEPCSQVHTYHLAASARMCEWSLTGLVKAIFYANVWPLTNLLHFGKRLMELY